MGAAVWWRWRAKWGVSGGVFNLGVCGFSLGCGVVVPWWGRELVVVGVGGCLRRVVKLAQKLIYGRHLLLVFEET